MGLDNFTSGNDTSSTDSEQSEKSSGSSKQSQMFTKEEFEEVLDETGFKWEIKDYDWTKEWVYETKSDEGTFIMRIYSSVDKRDNKSRKKDSDAIRLVVLHSETYKPVLNEKRTNRIKTWPKNLKKKIEKVKDRKDDLKFCNECGNVMIMRKNKDSGDKFWGCPSFPDCRYTEPIEG